MEGGSVFLIMETTETLDNQGEATDFQLESLLNKYHEVFEEPRGLLPTRELNNTITLSQEGLAINIRPYQYFYYKKMR